MATYRLQNYLRFLWYIPTFILFIFNISFLGLIWLFNKTNDVFVFLNDHIADAGNKCDALAKGHESMHDKKEIDKMLDDLKKQIKV